MKVTIPLLALTVLAGCGEHTMNPDGTPIDPEGMFPEVPTTPSASVSVQSNVHYVSYIGSKNTVSIPVAF